jgi:uncharacterized membrane protein
MKFSWRNEWIHWLLLAAMFGAAAITWPTAPDRIPVHWGIDFQVDRYGGRFEGLLGIPLEALALYALLLFIPRIDPGRANYERFGGAYRLLRLSLTVFLAALYGVVLLGIHGRTVNMAAAVPLLLGFLFLLIGNLLGKIRPNWFVGIRTPWTLSSKLAWTRTHRAGRWLFIAGGLVLIAMAFLQKAWVAWVGVGLLVAWAVGLAVYSYLVWRSDPDKTPPAGTLPA